MAEPSGEAPDALARAISERLQAVAPEGASPGVGAWLVRDQLDLLVDRPGSLEGSLATASRQILSDAQDEIVRDLKEGWPRAVGGVPGERDSGENLPEAEAAAVSGTLRLWYGDARPALELPPVELSGLGPAVQ